MLFKDEDASFLEIFYPIGFFVIGLPYISIITQKPSFKLSIPFQVGVVAFKNELTVSVINV